MEENKDILGYQVCKTCMTPKTIKQCKGKRSAFVMGKCKCGADQRTGKEAQAEMRQVATLEEVQAEIAMLTAPPEPVAEPKPQQTESLKPKETEPEPKPSDSMTTMKCVGAGAVIGLIFGGIFKTLRAVA